VPSRNRTSAEPTNGGEDATSDASIRPSSEPVMGSRKTNRCLKPRQSRHTCQCGSGQDGRQAGGEPVSSSVKETRGEIGSRQLADVSALSAGRSPHGVESGPTTGKGKLSEPGNPTTASFGMTEATGERGGRGRSSRSSQGTGKPSTRRRGAVQTASRQEGGERSPVPMNIGAILDMQRKLYGWSRNDPQKVHSDLFNLVCDERTLQLAWKQLSRNSGSRTPGIDGVTRQKIEERPGGVARFLETIRAELRNGTYSPQPVRQRLIPKPGKPGKFRPLGIPTLTDRLVQMELKIVLEPIFEADFHPTSYGFRRGRSTLDALAMIQRQLAPTKAGASAVAYIIEGDIKGCFDTIDHHLLMQSVRRRVKDAKVLRLLRAFLKAGILAEGSFRHPIAGTPQGGIISPLLANICLSALDARYARWTPAPGEAPDKAQARRRHDRQRGRPTFYLVRYADDFVILVIGTRQEAEAEKVALAAFLQQELHMELSLEKTHITEATEGFEFLGYRVVVERAKLTGRWVGKLRIPKGKLQWLRSRLKARTDRSTTGQSLEDLLSELNPIISGWRNYYRYATGATKDLAQLDSWLWQRIWLWLNKKHRGVTGRELRRRYRRRESPTRWVWGENQTLLKRFSQGGCVRYFWRGIRISNGWNEEMDGVRFYPEVKRPISGFTWVGELLR
jgi:RNA-directed DNA polymerase